MDFMKGGKTKCRIFHILIGKEKGEIRMNRTLIIDGNAVYEIDEECMLGKRMDQEKKSKKDKTENTYRETGSNIRKNQ